MRTISIFGSTGSIGKTALNFLKDYKSEWSFHALTSYENVDLLIQQAKEFNPEYAIIANKNLYPQLKEGLKGTKIKVESGVEQIKEIAKIKCDIVLMAITGIAALDPLVEAIKACSNIALANKEAIVCAGEIILDLAKKHNIQLLPVDSEHNAIFQLIDKRDIGFIDKIYLTASGGPFRTYSLDRMQAVTVDEALNHPNWKMGNKITIDSASMVNKSLELFEAHYLFNIPSEKIDIIIHPESIIHGMVDLIDGVTLASMNVPDMTSSIAYALNYPNRARTKVNKIDFVKLASLNFEEVDLEKFNAVKIARECLSSPFKSINCIIFNSANEVAVASFLKKKIKFVDITKIIKFCLEENNITDISSIEDVYEIDNNTRVIANNYIESIL